mmetsp:Transcript_2745/g.5224  ORF Transcript_2745/g.5224 Transcript_2745/m.5224 type:complete len:124 (+) Transcript_2745:40-411(+)
MRLFVFLLLLVFVCGSSHDFHFDFNNKTDTQQISASLGDELHLTFFGTPSTGFGWWFVSPLSPVVCKLDGDRGETDVPPNNFSYNFTVVSTGKEQLEFQYLKPWDRKNFVSVAFLDVFVNSKR